MPVYWIWFAQLKGLSAWQKQQLLENYADPEELYHADTRRLSDLPDEVVSALEEKDLTEARQILYRCNQRGIGILTYQDDAFPKRLRSIEDPPVLLYYRGHLPNWQAQPLIGVVGTRKASAYGLQTAHMLASQIAVCGGLVVSGMATGIDAASMEGALDAGKTTVGVLGGGVDVIYPASNRSLYRRIEANGCLLSEYPPGSRPFPHHFLQRNRIISGLSDGVLVVEAPEKSGALNTARHAFSQGRDMFAVPGNLGVDSCLGSNALLQEGAYPALSGWDVVKHYENLYPGAVEKRTPQLQKRPQEALPKVAQQAALPETQREKMEKLPKKSIDKVENSTYSVLDKRETSLSREEAAVLDLLSQTPQFPDAVLDRAELPPAMVQSILTRLSIKGLVQYQPDGRIWRK